MTPFTAYALPFTITPKTGMTLPTQIAAGQSTPAFYTITNNTNRVRNNNFLKYLPANVSQVTVNGSISDLCASSFSLQPANTAGSSCTLELLVTGAVNGTTTDSHQHLFACFPEGLTCAGTPSPLNVSVVNANTELVAAGYYIDNSNNTYIALTNSVNNGSTWTQQSLAWPSGYGDGSLNSASCTGSTCYGAGSYDDTNMDPIPVIVKSSDQGTTWLLKWCYL